MKIDYIKIDVEIRYKSTYVDGMPHITSSNRDFYVSEEKYKKILEILED